MPRVPWKNNDPLFRGDEVAGPAVPVPTAKAGIVAHILYLGGRGRETPYSSTSESEEVADHFAGPRGRVWKTTARQASAEGAAHVSSKQLLQNLKGFGKGKAKWHDAWEVAQAANYVEQWSEHLIDWTGVSPSAISEAVARAFGKGP